MKILSRIIVAGLLAAPLGCIAAAPSAGWYGGVSVGQSAVDMRISDWDDGTLTRVKLVDENIAYKVIAGYQFTPRIFLEGSYVQLGDIDFTAIEPGITPSLWETGPVTGQGTARGINLEGVYNRPFRERWAVFAKGGIFLWDTTTLSRPTISGGTLALGNEVKQNDNGVSWIFGVGADLRVYRDWHVRLEWEHTMVRFNGTLERGVDLPSLGVTLDF